MNVTCRFHGQRNFYNVCITKSEVASCWKLFLNKTELMLWFFTSQAAEEGSNCVSLIPDSKSQLFAWPLRFQTKEEQIPCRFQPSFCNDFNRFATLQRFDMPLQLLSSWRQDWGEQPRSYKLLHCKHFFMRHITQHHVAFDYWIDSRSGEALRHPLLPQAPAKLSGLSGFKPCAALNRNGMAKAARAGHTAAICKACCWNRQA